jgi:hypothetical protein
MQVSTFSRKYSSYARRWMTRDLVVKPFHEAQRGFFTRDAGAAPFSESTTGEPSLLRAPSDPHAPATSAGAPAPSLTFVAHRRTTPPEADDRLSASGQVRASGPGRHRERGGEEGRDGAHAHNPSPSKMTRKPRGQCGIRASIAPVAMRTYARARGLEIQGDHVGVTSGSHQSSVAGAASRRAGPGAGTRDCRSITRSPDPPAGGATVGA